MNHVDASIAAQTTRDQTLDIVLAPVSHPELGAIRITDALFAIGRVEPPFVDFPRECVTRLSRRHAKIFVENGAAYVADLDSKNGTTHNGRPVRTTPTRLRSGDTLAFGGDLVWRVALESHARVIAPAQRDKPLALTLTPERHDLELEPLDIHAFPFLISKTDTIFARHRDRYPHQVNYISRRHAHIFAKNGELFIEDLGSTNGTFVNGERLDESARPLRNGDRIAFGGDHFVYQVSIRQTEAYEPTVTHLSRTAAEDGASDSDKTTFVAAAHSFLDIFCVDLALQREDEVNAALHDDRHALAVRADAAQPQKTHKSTHGVWRTVAGEMLRHLAGDGRALRRAALWFSGAVVVIGALGVMLYSRGASERQVKSELASGDYDSAWRTANAYLRTHPSNTNIAAIASEALMKGQVPVWLKAMRERAFERADASIAAMRSASADDPDTSLLVKELSWVNDLERFVDSRGGVDAPVRMYRDESTIGALLGRWDDDAPKHQRLLDRIAGYVPEFVEPYALAMSHLRKLHTDDSVYIAAIDRLNASIATELKKDTPASLGAVIEDYAQRYPRLSGLDALRTDLRDYSALLAAVIDRKMASVMAAMASIHLKTPPFKAQYGTLAQSRLPSPDTVKHVDAANLAWQHGDSATALKELDAAPHDAWANEVAADRTRKQHIADEYASLKNGKADDDRLLSFYAKLDSPTDVWFAHAVQPQVVALKDRALARAADAISRAQGEYRAYRAHGAIGGTQRLESGISGGFRSQARLLSDAQRSTSQGMRIYRQLKADAPAGAAQLQRDVDAEVELQRRSLQELRMVLAPDLLSSKLALIGGSADEAR